MRLHPVQTCTGKTERVSSPAIDLPCCAAPEDLIKEDIGLETKYVCHLRLKR